MRKIDFLRSLSGDTRTKLLLHMDGVDNGTVFIDSSQAMRPITAVGDAKTTTSNKKFGTASATFDGTGDQITTPSNADFAFGTGDFTVEMWIYIVSWDNAALYQITTTGGFQFGREGTTTKWGVAQGGVAWRVQSSTLPTTGVWHHVAATRSGTTTRVFLDGTIVASGTDTSNYVQGALVIGDSFNGKIDELRVTNGFAWYTSNFTLATGPFLT